MPDISEIVDVTITVQSSALTRKGFESLMLVGSREDFGPGFEQYEVRKYTTAAQVSADPDILAGNISDMATVSFGQSPSVANVYISRVNQNTFQVGDLSYTGEFHTGMSIAVDINGSPIAGSPIAFAANHETTLFNIGAAIQAEVEVANATDTTPPSNINIVGQDIGNVFTVTSLVTGTVRSVLIGFSEPMVAGQNYQYVEDVTAKDVPFNTDWATTLDDIGQTMINDADVSNVGNATYTVDLVNNTVLILDTQIGFNGTYTTNPFVVGTNPVPDVTSDYDALFSPVATFVVSTNAVNPLSSDDLDAIAQNNNDWFGYSHSFGSTDDMVTASAWVAANKKYGFFLIRAIENPNLNTSFSSVWYTPLGYTGPAQWLQVAVASALLAQIPGSYTAALQPLQLVTPTQLTSTQEGDLRTQKTNQYSNVSGSPITWDGVTQSIGFIDTYIGVIYLEARISEDVFAQMAAVSKIPYTNAGVALIVQAVQARLDQSVVEGYLTDDPAPVTTAPLVQDISAVDKSNRLLPNVEFVAVTAGAIHTVQINGVVVA